MPKIIDTAEVTTSKLAALKGDGVETIIRYLTTASNSSKLVREPEARAIAGMGMKLALVFENWGGVDNFGHDDINANTGANHGAFVRAYAPQVGAPEGALVWFAIDTDCQPKQFEQLVVPYFRAIRQTIGKFRVGVYGSGFVCKTLLDRGMADGAWLAQSTGWMGFASFRDSKRWRILQGRETAFHGLDVDTNTQSLDPALADHGQFAPFDLEQAAPPGPPGGQPSPEPPAPPSSVPTVPAAPTGFAVSGIPQGSLILAAAAESPVLKHNFARLGKGMIGTPPVGYVKGMSLAYARCVAALADGNAVVTIMAGPSMLNDDSRDAMSWYRSKFDALGGLADKGGRDTLRHLFVLMIALGMNESSGKFCEGRDITAQLPPTGDTVEAGMFQMSWDARHGCPELVPLMRSYKASPDDPEGLGPVFHEGVRCSDKNLENVGSGDGRDFQRLSKASPMFAVLACGIGLRYIGGRMGHWGPIRRREVEIWRGCEQHLRVIDALLVDSVAATPPAVHG